MATTQAETKDVAMKEVDGNISEDKKEETPADAEALLLGDFQKNIMRVKTTGETKETRSLQRALRHTFSHLRKKITPKILSQLINRNFPNSDRKTFLLSFIPKESTNDAMDIDAPKTAPKEEEISKEILPEVEVYLHLLVAVYLVDAKRNEDALKCTTELVNRLDGWNRRTLDPLSSRAYFYYSRSYELVGRLAEIRPKLLALQRTATLRHNFDGQATILNLLLRNYLHYNLYDQADKLASRTEFKIEAASSNELARYYYYQGRIKAVQLDYTEAYTCLQQAIRKAPQFSANGFRAAVLKLSCIVQLLMGEIPERNIFRQKGIKNALKPYLEVVKAVGTGDLSTFQKIVQLHAETFKRDKMTTMIQRMRNNVIKTGLRKINLSYSRIHLRDICEKLNLESVDDAEFVAAKAVRDGIIDAEIHHAEGYIQSKEMTDVYSTTEPQNQFHRRIDFCHDIHNETVKAMRYPPQPRKVDAETEEERKQKQKEEQEYTTALAEEDEDEDDFY